MPSDRESLTQFSRFHPVTPIDGFDKFANELCDSQPRIPAAAGITPIGMTVELLELAQIDVEAFVEPPLDTSQIWLGTGQLPDLLQRHPSVISICGQCDQVLPCCGLDRPCPYKVTHVSRLMIDQCYEVGHVRHDVNSKISAIVRRLTNIVWVDGANCRYRLRIRPRAYTQTTPRAVILLVSGPPVNRQWQSGLLDSAGAPTVDWFRRHMHGMSVMSRRRQSNGFDANGFDAAAIALATTR
jgi:hypothetical protein